MENVLYTGSGGGAVGAVAGTSQRAATMRNREPTASGRVRRVMVTSSGPGSNGCRQITRSDRQYKNPATARQPGPARRDGPRRSSFRRLLAREPHIADQHALHRHLSFSGLWLTGDVR